MYACRGYVDVTQTLLGAGGRVDIVSSDGSTALHIAAFQGKFSLYELTNLYSTESNGAEILDSLLKTNVNDDILNQLDGPFNLISFCNIHFV